MIHRSIVSDTVSDPYCIIDPVPPLAGSLAVIIRSSWEGKLRKVQSAGRCQRFVVEAVISDHIPLAGAVEDLLARPVYHLLKLTHPIWPAYLHYGGHNAFYLDLKASSNSALGSIAIEVEAKVPSDAFWLGRTLANHFLDSQMLIPNDDGGRIWMPLMICRLDLYLKGEDVPIAHQCVMPYPQEVILGPFGGRDRFPKFAPFESLIREAITTGSPYYRLLCAFRLFGGVNGEGGKEGLRQFVASKAKELGINETLPKPAVVDHKLLEQLQLNVEFFNGVKNTNQLLERFRDERDRIAHFFLNKDSVNAVDLSHGQEFEKYSLIGSLLLHYSHQDFDNLLRFYTRHISPHVAVGQILPTVDRREDFTLRSRECQQVRQGS